MEGYNSSVFAYGATGAGKTFTMIGNQKNPGLMYHTIVELFRKIKILKNQKKKKIKFIKVSFLEIYNETIRDLL